MSDPAIPLDLKQAPRVIRQALHSGARVDFTKHAYDEMAADGLTVRDVHRALTSCRAIRRDRDVRSGDWKYTVEGASERKRIGVVTVIDTDPLGLTIITVWEVKGRWR